MKKSLLLTMVVVLVLSLLSGCTGKPAGNGKDGDTIRIGLNYELTGGVSSYGTSLTNGIELAIAEINAAGDTLGKKIEIVKFDNKSDDSEAANISTRLATRENVVALLGPATSGNTKAATPAAMENKIPLISASATDDDVTVDKNGKVRDYIFKTCFSDSFQGVIMAEFGINDLGVKTAAIYKDAGSDYAQGLSESFTSTFEAQGGKVVKVEAYQEGDTDFKAVLTSLKALNPDVLFIPGYYEEVGIIIRQAREMGFDIPVLGADGFESPKLVEIAGEEALNDIYYTSHYSTNDDSEIVTGFKSRFKEKYKSEPDAFNALGYDLGYFVVDAIKRAGEATPEKIKEALEASKDIAGVTGKFSMDEFHNPVKSVTIIEITNGVANFHKKLDPK